MGEPGFFMEERGGGGGRMMGVLREDIFAVERLKACRGCELERPRGLAEGDSERGGRRCGVREMWRPMAICWMVGRGASRTLYGEGTGGLLSSGVEYIPESYASQHGNQHTGRSYDIPRGFDPASCSYQTAFASCSRSSMLRLCASSLRPGYLQSGLQRISACHHCFPGEGMTATAERCGRLLLPQTRTVHVGGEREAWLRECHS